jgi:hypothetical protein
MYVVQTLMKISMWSQENMRMCVCTHNKVCCRNLCMTLLFLLYLRVFLSRILYIYIRSKIRIPIAAYPLNTLTYYIIFNIILNMKHIVHTPYHYILYLYAIFYVVFVYYIRVYTHTHREPVYIIFVCCLQNICIHIDNILLYIIIIIII